MIIRVSDREMSFPEGTVVRECLEKLNAFPEGTLAALCGGIVLELNEPLCSDADLTPLTLAHEEGRRVYERSIRFVMLLALKHLFPGKQVRIEFSAGHGVFVRVPEVSLCREDILRIENEMRRLTNLDLPFGKKRWHLEDAIRYFREDGQADKTELLRRRAEPSFTMYSLEDMWEYFYGAMTVSTGYVKVFSVIELLDGFVLQLPDGSDFSRPGPFLYLPKHLSIFAQSAHWCHLLGVNNVSDLARMADEHSLRNFIRVNEALHEKAMDEIAERIVQENRHIVLVAGPSSSGKTTFSGRLGVHLQTYGKHSRRISMDDFFINRDQIPLQPDGTRDFEDFAIVDLPLLSETISELLDGKEVRMPSYNFRTGCREYNTPPVRAKENEILIIEGIHGLNPDLVRIFPEHEVHRVFISALTCLNLDDHNRIRTTDVRLLRRIVRDKQYRGTSPETTLALWPSVRRGERKWIFAYQENADSVFNSALHYELLALKPYAYDALLQVSPASPDYLPARRLIKFLNYLPDIDPAVWNEIPNLSLLREFIGGCTMEEN